MTRRSLFGFVAGLFVRKAEAAPNLRAGFHEAARTIASPVDLSRYHEMLRQREWPMSFPTRDFDLEFVSSGTKIGDTYICRMPTRFREGA